MLTWWLTAPGARPLTLVAASVAIYGCVPETSNQMPSVGAVTAGMVVAEVVLRRRSPPGLLLTVAGVVLWSGLYGATGRESAIVGALFAFWPVVIVPLVALVRSRLRDGYQFTQLVISGVGTLAAVAVARTGGIDPDVGPALVSVAIAAPVSYLVAVVVAVVATRSDE